MRRWIAVLRMKLRAGSLPGQPLPDDGELLTDEEMHAFAAILGGFRQSAREPRYAGRAGGTE
jgi:hypothetical protein